MNNTIHHILSKLPNVQYYKLLHSTTKKTKRNKKKLLISTKQTESIYIYIYTHTHTHARAREIGLQVIYSNKSSVKRYLFDLMAPIHTVNEMYKYNKRKGN